jgi:hypothetical protein
VPAPHPASGRPPELDPEPELEPELDPEPEPEPELEPDPELLPEPDPDPDPELLPDPDPELDPWPESVPPSSGSVLVAPPHALIGVSSAATRAPCNRARKILSLMSSGRCRMVATLSRHELP